MHVHELGHVAVAVFGRRISVPEDLTERSALLGNGLTLLGRGLAAADSPDQFPASGDDEIDSFLGKKYESKFRRESPGYAIRSTR